MADTNSNTGSNSNPAKPDLNEHWKNLDAIFQAQLRKYVLTKKKDKFNVFAAELGFINDHHQYLFDSIQTHTDEMASKTYHKKSKHKRKRIQCFESDSSIDDEETEDEDDPLPPKRKRKRLSKKEQKKLEKLEKKGVYVVESIINHRNIGDNKYEYYVKWSGYEEKTWEPPDHLMPKSLSQYLEYNGLIMDNDGVITNKKNKSKSKTKTKSKKKKKKKKKSAKSEVFECKSCNKSFKNGQALGGHKSRKHPKKNKRSSTDSTPYWEDSDSEHTHDVIVIDDADDDVDL